MLFMGPKGELLDLIHVFVQKPAELRINRFDAAGDLLGRVQPSSQLLVGDEILVAVEPFADGQPLLGNFELQCSPSTARSGLTIVPDPVVGWYRVMARIGRLATVSFAALGLDVVVAARGAAVSRAMTTAVTLVALASLAGCEPETDTVELANLSQAPFASKASIETDREREVYVVELSVGVALAAACWDSCYPEQVCKLTSGDTDKLGVRPLYHLGSTQADDYVLVAEKVGVTTLRVDAACASQEYVVRVVAR